MRVVVSVGLVSIAVEGESITASNYKNIIEELITQAADQAAALDARRNPPAPGKAGSLN